MKNIFVLLALLPAICFAQCPSTNSLATAYNQNNGQRGSMFNISATNPVTILCFDANLYAGTTANYEIYYRTGGWSGFENNAAAWTMIGSTTGLTSLGANLPTPIPIPVNVFIPAGATYSFYITNDFGGGLSYTDGVTSNDLLASDANISWNGGIGKSYPFGLTFNPRSINATINYTPGVPLPVELVSFWATPVNNDVHLTWNTASEQNNDFFTIEHSIDGVNWEQIGRIEGAGTKSTPSDYKYVDSNPSGSIAYYRLSQTDFNGEQEFFEVKSVLLSSHKGNQLSVYPNPANNFIEITGSKDELEGIQLYDLMGRSVDQPEIIERHMLGVKLDIQGVEQGTYVLRTASQSAILIIE